MADVTVLPGVHREDLDAETPAQSVLETAKDAGIRDVVVVGRTMGGEIAVFATAVDADQAMGLLARGSVWLAGAQQVTGTS